MFRSHVLGIFTNLEKVAVDIFISSGYLFGSYLTVYHS